MYHTTKLSLVEGNWVVVNKTSPEGMRFSWAPADNKSHRTWIFSAQKKLFVTVKGVSGLQMPAILSVSSDLLQDPMVGEGGAWKNNENWSQNLHTSSNPPGTFWEKCFSVNHGKIAFGIKDILRAAQRTHTSNVPHSPLLHSCLLVILFCSSYILGYSSGKKGKWSLYIIWMYNTQYF